MRTDYDDELRRAQAHEEELERKMNMRDGASSANTSNRTFQQPYAHYPSQANVYGQQYRPQTANTNPSGKVIKLIAGMFYLIAVGMLVLMIVIVTNLRSKYEKCTAETTGTVVENVYHPPTDNEGSGAYSPVFEYTVDGRTYRKESDTGQQPPRYRVGETDTVHYDPNDPETFYVEKSDVFVMLIMGGISAGFLMFAIIITVAGVKGRKRKAAMMQ